MPQKYANEGIVTRAHYISELKSGVFIVVGGENRDIKMANAVALIDELNAMYKEATGNPRVDGREVREIDPVAILPK